MIDVDCHKFLNNADQPPCNKLLIRNLLCNEKSSLKIRLLKLRADVTSFYLKRAQTKKK